MPIHPKGSRKAVPLPHPHLLSTRTPVRHPDCQSTTSCPRSCNNHSRTSGRTLITESTGHQQFLRGRISAWLSISFVHYLVNWTARVPQAASGDSATESQCNSFQATRENWNLPTRERQRRCVRKRSRSKSVYKTNVSHPVYDPRIVPLFPPPLPIRPSASSSPSSRSLFVSVEPIQATRSAPRTASQASQLPVYDGQSASVLNSAT